MKLEVARRRIESFQRRFGQAHLIFAYHGAFPLALTPDLLYKLWANFQRDIHGKALGIPWVAVADLLLSSLCNEVGHELYEMDGAVRKALLSRLQEDENFGQQRINELSDFLLVYVRQQLQSSDPDVRDFAQAQRWTALAYVRPNEAARELREALAQAYQQDKAEQVRLASLVETFAEPLAGFEPLLVYAREMKQPSGDVDKPSDSQQQHIGTNLVILEFDTGSFETGFNVTLQIWRKGYRGPILQIAATLPPAPEIPSQYHAWQSYYQDLVGDPARHRHALMPRKDQRTNFSLPKFQELANLLRSSINTWLNSAPFRPVVYKIRQSFTSSELECVLLVTEDTLLQRLPWHLWDLLNDYPKAEVTLGYTEFTRIKKSTPRRNKVRILAILGDALGIDLEADQKIIAELTWAETVFLREPTRNELLEQLSDESGWDIFYFGGLSSSNADYSSVKIRINSADSLTTDELKYSFKKATEQGLKLAIFNSCDGLGLAKELANLGIPAIIAMRGNLADQVAQEFLKNFMSAFSRRQSLYASMREARERLQALEGDFPCASWLPVIVQNQNALIINWSEWLQGISPDD